MEIISTAVILFLALIYGYLHGTSASASVVATIISSRAIGPRKAIVLAAVATSLGPFLLGTAVANTIGQELISTPASTAHVVVAGLTGAIFWTAFTLWLKIPSSVSQALIGGLVGAALAGFGAQAILTQGLQKALTGLFISPILGLVMGFIFVRLSYQVCRAASPHVNTWFNRGQVFVSVFMALSLGANDGQKIIGILTLGLVSTGFLHSFSISIWVTIISAAMIGIGTLLGGWRLIHTLGGKFYKIRPVHGFSAQLASGAIILSLALVGGPVSGSQVVTSAIVGAGSADRLQKVRWGVFQQILTSWVFTLPMSALAGAVIYSVIQRL